MFAKPIFKIVEILHCLNPRLLVFSHRFHCLCWRNATFLDVLAPPIVEQQCSIVRLENTHMNSFVIVIRVILEVKDKCCWPLFFPFQYKKLPIF